VPIRLRAVPTVTAALLLSVCPAHGQDCIPCHQKNTPSIVSDWKLSKHRQKEIDCSHCHGAEHQSSQDIANAKIPTAATCGRCHEERGKQFRTGKHAAAWSAMKSLPTFHWQPMALREGMKGCGGCHKIGLKSGEELKDLRKEGAGFGLASCDACHTRHLFSVREAKQPQACQTCHTGLDHPQWEMYSGSKHGVRFLLKQNRILPPTVAAPTCQTCHMPDGHHGVRTAWGFLAVRLPLPENRQWAADRSTILRALGFFDSEETPTRRLELLKAADMARLTEEDWQRERDRMVKICNRCHSLNFAKAELAKGDRMIAEADRLMAEAIREVAELYQEGILPPPQSDSRPFPDLLTFHDAPTRIEQKLSAMFFQHRMRAFQGTFHANPDYALWHGWSELRRSLTEIREMAAELRARAKGKE
jgi:hydroxylamine dehydrogenase